MSVQASTGSLPTCHVDFAGLEEDEWYVLEDMGNAVPGGISPPLADPDPDRNPAPASATATEAPQAPFLAIVRDNPANEQDDGATHEEEEKRDEVTPHTQRQAKNKKGARDPESRRRRGPEERTKATDDASPAPIGDHPGAILEDAGPRRSKRLSAAARAALPERTKWRSTLRRRLQRFLRLPRAQMVDATAEEENVLEDRVAVEDTETRTRWNFG